MADLYAKNLEELKENVAELTGAVLRPPVVKRMETRPPEHIFLGTYDRSSIEGMILTEDLDTLPTLRDLNSLEAMATLPSYQHTPMWLPEFYQKVWVSVTVNVDTTDRKHPVIEDRGYWRVYRIRVVMTPDEHYAWAVAHAVDFYGKRLAEENDGD